MTKARRRRWAAPGAVLFVGLVAVVSPGTPFAQEAGAPPKAAPVDERALEALLNAAKTEKDPEKLRATFSAVLREVGKRDAPAPTTAEPPPIKPSAGPAKAPAATAKPAPAGVLITDWPAKGEGAPRAAVGPEAGVPHSSDPARMAERIRAVHARAGVAGRAAPVVAGQIDAVARTLHAFDKTAADRLSQSANELAAVDPAAAARLLRRAQDLQASGDPKAALRIIQGVAATEGQFPHCVALGSAPPGGAPAFSCCTGTLVGPNVVVTAAHCMPCRLTHVYFGTDARTPNPDRVFAIKGIVTHKDYDRTGRSENDIAVLVLEKNVPGVRPCPIATDADVSAAAFIRIVGFGLTDNDRNKAIRDVMFTADVTVADRSCQNGQVPIEGGATLPCHAGKELVTVGFGKDTCYGDSGGPAYVESGGELRLAGATSRGSKVCGFYAVYTRVDRYRDWVVGAAAVYGGVVAPPPGEAVVVTSGVRPDCTDHASEIRARLDWWSTHYPQYVPK